MGFTVALPSIFPCFSVFFFFLEHVVNGMIRFIHNAVDYFLNSLFFFEGSQPSNRYNIVLSVDPAMKQRGRHAVAWFYYTEKRNHPGLKYPQNNQVISTIELHPLATDLDSTND
jgi:hypothetical protein